MAGGRSHPDTARWRRIRKIVLERDHRECCYYGCGREATQVDHIHPVSLGGDYYALDNLRAICAHHNASRGNGTRRRGQGGSSWQAARTPAAFPEYLSPRRVGSGPQSTVTHREVP
jgi:5-methylcytosine-specific restriction endonuclease McrA